MTPMPSTRCRLDWRRLRPWKALKVMRKATLMRTMFLRMRRFSARTSTTLSTATSLSAETRVAPLVVMATKWKHVDYVTPFLQHDVVVWHMSFESCTHTGCGSYLGHLALKTRPRKTSHIGKKHTSFYSRTVKKKFHFQYSLLYLNIPTTNKVTII